MIQEPGDLPPMSHVLRSGVAGRAVIRSGDTTVGVCWLRIFKHQLIRDIGRI